MENEKWGLDHDIMHQVLTYNKPAETTKIQEPEQVSHTSGIKHNHTVIVRVSRKVNTSE